MCSPKPPLHSKLKDENEPEPLGSTGVIAEMPVPPIFSPLTNRATSTTSSVSTVPAFSKYTVTVTSSPGSGALGLNSIPLPSVNGLTSGIAVETTMLPRTMSRVASPSTSAREGDDQVLCSTSISSDHSELIPADDPVEPSKAQRDLP